MSVVPFLFATKIWPTEVFWRGSEREKKRQRKKKRKKERDRERQ